MLEEGKYKFGFNGKENDNEVKGQGNSIDFGTRIYDSRLGKWLSVDPAFKEYPSISPYAFVVNNPTNAVDPDGKRVYFIAGAGNDNQGWNYVNRFRRIWTQQGIRGFTRINASHGKTGDMIFSNTWRKHLSNGQYSKSGVINYASNDGMVKKAVNDMVADLTRDCHRPLK
jgi:RHS repeat-associated protein